MKKFIAGLAALLIALASIPVSAASTDIKNATPVVDGKMDAIYKQSASIELEKFGFYKDGSGKASITDADINAVKGTTVYMLWDKDYLYLCANVVDNSVTTGKEEGVDYKSWSTNDNLELYFWADNGLDATRGNIHVGCLGLGLDPQLMYKDLNIKVVGTATATGYVTEIAIPANNFNLKAGSAFMFALQYNNYIPAIKAASANGYQNAKNATKLTLSADKAVVESTVKPAVQPSDATFDGGLMALAALAASGAALVSLKKKSAK